MIQYGLHSWRIREYSFLYPKQAKRLFFEWFGPNRILFSLKNGKFNLISVDLTWIPSRFLCVYIIEQYSASYAGRTMEAPLRYIHGRICSLHWLKKWLIWLKNWLSHLYSHKYLYRDIFVNKILSHEFFKVSLKSKHKI